MITELKTARAVSTPVNGERRSFALLRPIVDSTAQIPLRDLILTAYAEYAGDMNGADSRS